MQACGRSPRDGRACTKNRDEPIRGVVWMRSASICTALYPLAKRQSVTPRLRCRPLSERTGASFALSRTGQCFSCRSREECGPVVRDAVDTGNQALVHRYVQANGLARQFDASEEECLDANVIIDWRS